MNMKKKFMPGFLGALIAMALELDVVTAYNGLVAWDQNELSKRVQKESVLQLRAELVPGALLTERETFDSGPFALQAKNGTVWIAWMGSAKGREDNIFIRSLPAGGDPAKDWGPTQRITPIGGEYFGPTGPFGRPTEKPSRAFSRRCAKKAVGRGPSP
jgi:hypothetical protein